MKLVSCTASALKIRTMPDLAGATDTGERMIAGQVARAYGATFDGKWMFVEAPAGTGWASADFLKVLPEAPARPNVPAVVVPPVLPWPRVPRGLAEIIQVFGEPCSARCSSGRVSLPAPLKQSWDGQVITRFACHELMVPVFASVFSEIHRRGLWDLLEDFGGVYNCREVKASAKRSTHSWGIGIDLNANRYPLGSRKRQDRRLIAIFADHGFVNGEDWGRPDPMHWQRAVGY